MFDSVKTTSLCWISYIVSLSTNNAIVVVALDVYPSLSEDLRLFSVSLNMR